MNSPLVHPTAAIHPGAELHPTVRVGPYAVIGDRVRVGANTEIGAHVVLEGPTIVGEDNRIFPGAAIGLEPQDLKYSGDESWVEIGDRNLIREYVTINRATGAGEVTRIGNDVLLMAYTHVAHNCAIEDGAIIANNVALAGHVCVEAKARIGGIVAVHQFVRIGSLAMVGGMSRIDRDVPPYTTVAGSPARVRSLNSIGLQRNGFEVAELAALKKAFRLLYRSEHTFEAALAALEPLCEFGSLQHLREFLQASISEPERRGSIPGTK